MSLLNNLPPETEECIYYLNKIDVDRKLSDSEMEKRLLGLFNDTPLVHDRFYIYHHRDSAFYNLEFLIKLVEVDQSKIQVSVIVQPHTENPDLDFPLDFDFSYRDMGDRGVVCDYSDNDHLRSIPGKETEMHLVLVNSLVFDFLDLIHKDKDIREGKERKRLKVKGTKKKYNDLTIIHLCKYQNIPTHQNKNIEWSHSWKVRGHWRKTNNLGKDRNGLRNQVGRTWVVPSVKQKHLPFLNKTRVFGGASCPDR